jgi:hypothetical protein
MRLVRRFLWSHVARRATKGHFPRFSVGSEHRTRPCATRTTSLVERRARRGNFPPPIWIHKRAAELHLQRPTRFGGVASLGDAPLAIDRIPFVTAGNPENYSHQAPQHLATAAETRFGRPTISPSSLPCAPAIRDDRYRHQRDRHSGRGNASRWSARFGMSAP